MNNKKTFIVSKETFLYLLGLCKKPPKPNRVLKNAIKRYKKWKCKK